MLSVLLEQGFVLLHHRTKIQNTEIDLILKSQNNKKQIILVEVKSLTTQKEFIHLRWPHKQKSKFQKVLKSIEIKYPYYEVIGILALADTTRVEFYFLDQV